MKTLLLAIGFVSNILSANAQNVNIPDANFKAYLVGNTAINTNVDSEIQLSEAQSFTGTIGCSGLNISDLTGIEFFTSLTHLGAGNNLITSIDLSNNTALTNLDLFNNQLTSLDLSNNLLLELLGCSNNLFTDLNFVNNVNLTEVFCMGMNSLTSLNIKNGNNIIITQFNTTGCPNLTCIEVDDATWSTTNWTDIESSSTFSEDCLGTNGINENNTSFLSIFPNPTRVEMKIISNANTKIMISSSNGMLMSHLAINNETTIDVSSYAPGIYFIRTAEGQTVKFIKE